MPVMGMYSTKEYNDLKAKLVEAQGEIVRVRMELFEKNLDLLIALEKLKRSSSREVGSSEAEDAFEPFRRDIAKRIVSAELTTENALLIARRAFITGFKKGRE